MKSSVKTLLVFVAGLAVGAGSGYFITKKKYEKIADEEIASVKEVFQKKLDSLTCDNDESKDEPENPKYDSPQEYLAHHPEIDKPSYEQEEQDESKKEDRQATLKKESDDAHKKYNKALQNVGNACAEPYVIKPHEYGDQETYDLISLTLTSDGEVIDDRNTEILSDVEDVLGNCLTFMGEFAENVVHIRNEQRMCDYEVCKDIRTAEEIIEDRS